MAILYFLADEPVQNHQQQDCRLIVEVHAPDGADIKWVHAEAEIAMKEKFGEAFALKPTTEQAASKYLEEDPGTTHGALNLATDVLRYRNPRHLEMNLAPCRRCGARPQFVGAGKNA